MGGCRYGSKSAVSASALKAAIDRKTDSFAGYVQHDASEWLAFVLDMVHEDLNRIEERK